MRSLRCRGPPSYWSAADAVLLFISFNAIEAKIAEQDSGSCASTKNGVILRKLYPLTKVLWLLQNRLKRFIQLESLLFRSVFKPICTLQSPPSQMQSHLTLSLKYLSSRAACSCCSRTLTTTTNCKR